jgi:hypothetical protein
MLLAGIQRAFTAKIFLTAEGAENTEEKQKQNKSVSYPLRSMCPHVSGGMSIKPDYVHPVILSDLSMLTRTQSAKDDIVPSVSVELNCDRHRTCTQRSYC